MSPEQAAGDAELDGRTDQYSLGCVLYEMLAGHSPFLGKNPQEVRARHALDSVPPLRAVRATVSDGIEAALQRALAKQPADRFATAGEFAVALSRTARSSATLTSPPADAASRLKWILPVAAIVLVIAGGGAVVWNRLPPVPVSATRLAVLPLVPSGADTGLVRLGRDLVVTLSANLDGVGDIWAVDANTILTQTAEGRSPLSLADAAALARRLGAGSVIRGSLVRTGTNVRVELGLFDTKDLSPLARSTVTASPEAAGVITDSLTAAVLTQIWRKGTPPSPSLAAVTTHSIPALRAFLEGERLLVEGNLDSAAGAYQRAFTADTAFWLAYFRYAYVFNWTERNGADSMAEIAWQHRTALPERERLLLAIPREDGQSLKLKRSREFVERYPDYWPGWFQLADYLVHGGGMDYTVDETIAALERTVTLNPDVWWAWEHLFGVTLAYDTTKAARALAEMARLGNGTHGRARPFYLPGYRLLLRTVEFSPVLDTALMDTVARSFAAGKDPFLGMPQDFTFLIWGFGKAQVEYNRRVLRIGVDRERATTMRNGTAAAWANRGAWDSVQSALDDYVASATKEQGAVPASEAYRFTVFGAWLGAVDLSDALTRRTAVARAELRFPGSLSSYHMTVGLWLDGLRADAERDQEALKLARQALWADTAWFVKSFERSLAAFELGLAGKYRPAADSMVALVRAVAERRGVCCTGAFDAVNRLAASRWLLAAGDTGAAGKIIGELDLADAQQIFFGGPMYLARARINEALGHKEESRSDYAQFLRRYDLPAETNRYLVQEAREALRRLGGPLDEPR
jgi:tetratricopeptide (TPR) repeat protein